MHKAQADNNDATLRYFIALQQHWTNTIQLIVIKGASSELSSLQSRMLLDTQRLVTEADSTLAELNQLWSGARSVLLATFDEEHH
jgi:hypothetical protein